VCRARSLFIAIVFAFLARGASALAAPAPDPVPDPRAVEHAWKEAFDREIAGLSRRFKGRISVYVSDYTRGVRYRHDIDKPCYLASGVKITFMLEVFRQVQRGILSMDDVLTYEADDVRDGAPRINKKKLGDRVTVRELLGLMIHASDNSASDMLVRKVGIENVNLGLAAEGFSGFGRITSLLDVRRGVYRAVDPAADDLGPLEIRKLRWTSIWDPQVRQLERMVGKPPRTYRKEDLLAAYDRFYETGVNHAKLETVGDLLERLAQRTLVSEAASEEMLKLLYGVGTGHNRIRARLPPGTPVAHKTGSQYERICDLGLIGLPDETQLVVASCMAGGEDRVAAEATLAAVARKAYDLAVELRKDPKSR
jgi:beta-lactamase class A